MTGGRLQEVPNMVFDLETFGIWENWLLRRGGRNRRFNCRNLIYAFWKSRQQQHFVMFSLKCRCPNHERFTRKITPFP